MELAYHADTEEALDSLMKFLYSIGYSWKGDGEPALETDNVIYANNETRSLEVGFWDSYKKLASFDKDIGELVTVQSVDGKLSYSDKNIKQDIRPDYYKQNGHDLFDHFTEMFPEEGFRGFMIGNIFKYVMRYPAKNGIEDLRKAQTYLNRLIQFEKGKSDEE